MARPLWTGSISFGLVNIPIKLFSAIEESSLDLDMLDQRDFSNIKYKRVSEETGKEVPWDNIVKGYKYNGRYVVLEDKDFEKAAAEKTKRIDIQSFILEKEIDPIYYDTTYYVGAGKQDQKTYALLRDAMKKTGMVALGTFVLRNREHLGVLKVHQHALVLTKLHFKDEIRDLKDYPVPAATVKSNPSELKMAVSLIKQMEESFDITKFKDQYTQSLLKFIKQKAKGKTATPKKPSGPIPKEANSLMEQLKASLQKSTPASRRKTKKETK